MSRPADLKYTSTHEWLRVEGDIATVGITDWAVEQLGDLAFVDLPQVGSQVEKDSTLGEIESTKAVSDLIAPVTGEITEVNGEVVENLQLITHSPFEDGWLIRIRMADKSETDALMSSEDYAAHVEAEEH